MDLSSVFTGNLQVLSGDLWSAYTLVGCALLGLFFLCELGRGLSRRS